MANTTDELEARIRARLKQLRFERGLTLAQVAQRAGAATSTVSRLESGARPLGLERLDRLTRALGADLTEVIGAASIVEPRPASDGKLWWPLGSERPDELRVYKIRFPSELREPVLETHEGHVWMLVLDGRLRIVTQTRDVVLRTGHATTFNTWIPHWFGVVSEPADVLAVFSPTGTTIKSVSVAD